MDSDRSSSAAPARPAGRCRVLLPLPLAGAYDYAADPALDLVPGDFVTVPLGRREVAGVVWDAAAEPAALDEARLRPVVARLDAPPLPVVSRRFVEWVGDYVM